MDLNERKVRILEAVIRDYIATAEPVGSRTISKKFDFGISSATIRNEMSDLEEMGYIIQPHASSGRIPSDKGYRFYVDTLMTARDLSADESDYLRRIINENVGQIDYLMRETAKAIAMLTGCATVVSEPLTRQPQIKHIQLVPVDGATIALVLVDDSKNVKNQLIRLSRAPSYDELVMLSSVLSGVLCGLSQDMIDRDVIERLKAGFAKHADALEPVLIALNNALKQSARLYTSGMKNILEFPEFSDLPRAKSMFQALEEKDVLVTLIGNPADGKINIIIGAENDIADMQGCSVIKTGYRIGLTRGGIGIIGPTRMDYTQAVSVLGGIVRHINRIIEALDGG